jgi:FKBP-type peptidyl-prolyl cis-trans isomerase SlyD
LCGNPYRNNESNNTLQIYIAMVIAEQKVGILTYSIHIEDAQGELLEQASNDNPRTLLFGTGRLLKSFENKLMGLKSGDSFEFVLSPEEAFGNQRDDMVMEIPVSAFLVDGEMREGMLEIGKIIPMMDSEGNALNGTVVAVNGDKVTMDFNHPLAGKSLYTSGNIMHVREATEEELNPAPSGCGCGTPNDACCGGSESHEHHHHQHEHHH